MILGQDLLSSLSFIINFESRAMILHEFRYSTSCDILAAKLLLNIFDKESDVRDNDMNDDVTILTSDKCSCSTLHNKSLAQEVNIDPDGYNAKVICTSKYDAIKVCMVIEKCTYLSKEQQTQLYNVLSRFPTLFNRELKKYTDHQVHLELKPNVIPTCSHAYPIPLV